MTQTPPQKLPNQCDVVIIGAGMGGLTAGAILSKAGLNTVILEAEEQPGGYLAGFRRGEFKFETAVHWLSQCGPDGFVRNIFGFIDDDMPECRPLKRVHRFIGDGHDYSLTTNPLELRDTLIQDFPGDEDGIRRFFEDARKLGKHMEILNHRVRSKESMSLLEQAVFGVKMLAWVIPVLKFLRPPVDVALDRYFKSPRLRQVFCSQERFMSVIVPVAWAFIDNFQATPKGGGVTLAHWLCRKIYQSDTEIYLDCPVDRILLDDSKTVTGVETNDGRRIDCNYVIAASDIHSLYNTMLPEGSVPPDVLESVNSAELHESCFGIYLGLDCPAEDLGLGEEVLNITTDNISREEHMCGDPEKTIIMIVASSARDASMAPEGKGCIMILTPAFMDYKDNWGTGPNYSRGDAYKAVKAEYADIVMKRVEEKVPGLKDHIEFMETSSPVTFWRYTKNFKGTIMGAKPVGANIRSNAAHYRTPIKNLYIGGHCAEYGGGVPLAVKAGANSSLLVLKSLNHPSFRDLKHVLS